MTTSTAILDRAVISISGPEARSFLQGLITSDVRKLEPDRVLYAALLTPQGKILFDFFLHEDQTAVLLDCAADAAEALQKRLLLYRLRTKVEILYPNDLHVRAEWGDNFSQAARQDPRTAALGLRSIVHAGSHETASPTSYTAHRLDLGVPEGRDLGQDSIFALDAGLEELHGVSFEKGCYIGQELTARMKHRGTARKRLLPIATEAAGLPDAGTAVTAGEREIGTISSVYGNRGFALLRLDRLREADGQQLESGRVPVSVNRPAWLRP